MCGGAWRNATRGRARPAVFAQRPGTAADFWGDEPPLTESVTLMEVRQHCSPVPPIGHADRGAAATGPPLPMAGPPTERDRSPQLRDAVKVQSGPLGRPYEFHLIVPRLLFGLARRGVKALDQIRLCDRTMPHVATIAVVLGLRMASLRP